MRFDIMTLFPDLVLGVLSSSIIGRAQKNHILTIEAHNIRDFSGNKHNRVDDTPYGGGMGMLMRAEPIYRCYQSILKEQIEAGFDGRRHVVYLSPAGKVFNQEKAASLAKNYDNIIMLCGHYEGVDRRIVDEIVDEEISIGDYVLTGGEIPACILTDCISRLIPGVLSDAECYEKESLGNGLLEYPQFTRPLDYHGIKVPDVLLSGNHAAIEDWREKTSLIMTERYRPDLLTKEKLPQD